MTRQDLLRRNLDRHSMIPAAPPPSAQRWAAYTQLSASGRQEFALRIALALACTCLLACWQPAPAAAQGFTVGTRLDFTTGASPRSVATGDLNGDGAPDMVVADSAANTVSVLLGNGVGGFGAKTDFATGSGPCSVAIADVNGDGKFDIVAANCISNTASVLLGNGAGSFGTKLDFATGAGPFSVAIGDLNGDGKLDIVTANRSDNTVSVLLGNGAGGFGTKTDFATGAGPCSVGLGDLNGDATLDIAVANVTAGSVSILLGDGAGGFGAKSDYATASGARSVAIGDVSGDGQLDLVVANQSAATVTVLLGNGAGGIASKADYATGTGPVSVAIGDVNGDGKPDLAVADLTASKISLLPGAGSGSFGAKSDFATAAGPVSLAIADVNGDGKPDLVAANYISNIVSVLLGNGAGGFGTKTDFATGATPYTVAIGDLSGDGKHDIVTANRNDNTVSVLLGNGAGGFGTKTDFATGAFPWSVAIGDVNGDGKPDLVAANMNANTASVLLGNGAGGFGTKTDFATGAGPSLVAIEDLNGDGQLDIVTANWNAATASVLMGNGAGGFGTKTDFVTGGATYSVAIGDLNGDGKLDIVTANMNVNTASVLLGNGAGGFGIKTDFATGTGPYSAAIEDLNGDGKLDLVVANLGANTVSVLLALAPTRALLASSLDPSLLGTALTLTASVAVPAPFCGVPTGSVSFFDGFTLLGTSVLSGNTAAFALSSPYLGTRALRAVYGGDGRFFGGISPVWTQQVLSAAPPTITSARDVPNDQGGKVSLRWAASALDHLPNNPVDAYWIWRQVPNGLVLAALEHGAHLASDGPAPGLPTCRIFRSSVENGRTYYWEYLGSVSAHGLAGYSCLAATAFDSLGGSNPYTLFMVRAQNASGTEYWDSAPDSGYSVDNLAPLVPAPFTAQYANGTTSLHWGVSGAADFAAFRLYRGDTPGFVPGPGNLVVAQPDTGYVDHAGVPHYYRLSAVDVHGNESAYAFVLPGGATDVPQGGSVAFALAGAWPNPSMGPLSVTFTLPEARAATLSLYDLGGRCVLEREVGALGPGRHTLALATDRALAPGVYLVRLTQGTHAASARVAILK